MGSWPSSLLQTAIKWILPWFLLTLYLCLADSYAISEGIWTLEPATRTGWELGNLPIEEALFFALTNLFVFQGLSLWQSWKGSNAWNGSSGTRFPLVHPLGISCLLPTRLALPAYPVTFLPLGLLGYFSPDLSLSIQLIPYLSLFILVCSWWGRSFVITEWSRKVAGSSHRYTSAPHLSQFSI